MSKDEFDALCQATLELVTALSKSVEKLVLSGPEPDYTYAGSRVQEIRESIGHIQDQYFPEEG